MEPARAIASVSPYSPGDCIVGKYRLDRMLGTGGMCTVWLATHLGLDRRVAVKLMRGDLPPTESGRLLREARALGRVEHPAIVRVYDYGETETGEPYVVMEFLDGFSFGDSLDGNGPLTPTAACRLLLPVIDGLAVAHEAAIVHRDIKPGNVFLAREGSRIQPKLIDFGIAKFEARDPKPKLTMNGAILGSPAYMAPEQARGRCDVDHRSDIWAISVVLYEAVAGSTPFRGINYNAVLRSIIEDGAAPLRDSGNGETEFWTILAKGLAKRRNRRFQSARELAAALSGFLLERGVTTDVCGAPLSMLLDGGRAPNTPEMDRGVRHLPPLGSANHFGAPVGLSATAVALMRTERRPRSGFFAWPAAAALFAGAAALVVPRQFDAWRSTTAAVSRFREAIASTAFAGPENGGEGMHVPRPVSRRVAPSSGLAANTAPPVAFGRAEAMGASKTTRPDTGAPLPSSNPKRRRSPERADADGRPESPHGVSSAW